MNILQSNNPISCAIFLYAHKQQFMTSVIMLMHFKSTHYNKVEMNVFFPRTPQKVDRRWGQWNTLVTTRWDPVEADLTKAITNNYQNMLIVQQTPLYMQWRKEK